MKNYVLYQEDLPANLNPSLNPISKSGGVVAIDTETMGLSPHRDRLCLVQLSWGDDCAHLVQFAENSDYAAPNLRCLLSDTSQTKIMHYGRFDLAILYKSFGIMPKPVFCTKIASRLARTYTYKHGLKALCRDVLEEEIDKQKQISDWGAKNLSDKQLAYAAADVLYLHRLRDELTQLLQRENRYDLAQACFDFLPSRACLDLLGWGEVDIFAHS